MIRKSVPCNTQMPRYYGTAWIDQAIAERIAYPIPFNLLAHLLNEVHIFFKCGIRRTSYDLWMRRRCADHYIGGYADGHSDAQIDVHAHFEITKDGCFKRMQ